MKNITAALCALTLSSALMSRIADGATARMASEIFVTNKVAAVSNYVDRVVGERTPVKRIAMFIIPVNMESTSSSFVGFELKASTNNFSHAVGNETPVLLTERGR